MEKKYSILTYNIGGYEVLHEVENPSPICEYIYITDDKTISSSTWNVVYVENEHPEDNFDICYYIRYHLFDYITTDVVIRIDGSMSIVGDTDILYNKFEEGKYDMCLQLHPQRYNMYAEQLAWEAVKGYSRQQTVRILSFISKNGYDPLTYKGLFQFNFIMQRRNKFNMDFNRIVFSFLKYFAEEGKQIEKNDQVLAIFIINKWFNNGKFMVIDDDIANNKLFHWHYHGGNNKVAHGMNIAKYMFNKEVETDNLGL